MKILGIIPSRYGSSRFPGKPLVKIGDKTMIRHVYERSLQSSSLTELMVATDDERIYSEVSSFGGNVIMTNSAHLNGSERCAEVAAKHPEFEYIINIQGDEPFIHQEQIDRLASLLDGKVEIGTLIKKVTNPEVLDRPSDVKVVINKRGEAQYFSRQCIPFLRDFPKEKWLTHHTFYKHIGIYAYRRDVLAAITKLPPAPLERMESLEQLRWIEYGYKIVTAVTDKESQMIDTPEDLQTIKKSILT